MAHKWLVEVKRFNDGKLVEKFGSLEHHGSLGDAIGWANRWANGMELKPFYPGRVDSRNFLVGRDGEMEYQIWFEKEW